MTGGTKGKNKRPGRARPPVFPSFFKAVRERMAHRGGTAPVGALCPFVGYTRTGYLLDPRDGPAQEVRLYTISARDLSLLSPSERWDRVELFSALLESCPEAEILCCDLPEDKSERLEYLAAREREERERGQEEMADLLRLARAEEARAGGGQKAFCLLLRRREGRSFSAMDESLRALGLVPMDTEGAARLLEAWFGENAKEGMSE